MFLKLTARWGRGRDAARWTRLLVLLSPVNSTSKKLFRSFRSVFLCHLLQNHTLTTSFSRLRVSDTICSSSLVGLGFWLKALSSAILTLDSMLVLFFRRRPMASSELWLLW